MPFAATNPSHLTTPSNPLDISLKLAEHLSSNVAYFIFTSYGLPFSIQLALFLLLIVVHMCFSTSAQICFSLDSNHMRALGKAYCYPSLLQWLFHG